MVSLIGTWNSRKAGAEGGSSVVPIDESDYGRFVVDIVQVSVRIIGVVDNHCTTETVAVLSCEMAVVPVRAGLVGDVEVVQERVPCRDGALVHKGSPVGPVGAFLEETVPVLERAFVRSLTYGDHQATYNSGRREHCVVGEIVDYIELEVVALHKL